MRRFKLLGACALVLACGNTASDGQADDVVLDVAPVDGTGEDALCDSSPVALEDGTTVMYGCEFYHHVYKITMNGEEVTGDLEVCDSTGYCIYRLTHTCGRYYLLDNGEISIIVDRITGEIRTHGRLHTGDSDDLPERLEPPITTAPH